MDLKELKETCHKIAKEKGWWQDEERNFAEQIALMHSELSEALEEYRVWGLDDQYFIYTKDESPKPEGIAVEFADLIIRLLDTCGAYGLPIERAIEEKLEYNKTRKRRHGNKLC